MENLIMNNKLFINGGKVSAMFIGQTVPGKQTLKIWTIGNENPIVIVCDTEEIAQEIVDDIVLVADVNAGTNIVRVFEDGNGVSIRRILEPLRM